MNKDLMQTLEYFINYPQEATPGKIRGFLVRLKKGIEDSERLKNALGSIPEAVIDEIVKSLAASLITKQPKNMEEWKDVWRQHVMYIARELHLAARPMITGEWIEDTVRILAHAEDSNHAAHSLRERLGDLKMEVK